MEPIIQNPFGRKTVGMKFTLKSKNKRREIKIRKILSEICDINFRYIYEDQNLFSDLMFDSLEYIELIMDLEEAFNIEINDEDVEVIETVKDVYALIEKCKG